MTTSMENSGITVLSGIEREILFCEMIYSCSVEEIKNGLGS